MKIDRSDDTMQCINSSYCRIRFALAKYAAEDVRVQARVKIENDPSYFGLYLGLAEEQDGRDRGGLNVTITSLQSIRLRLPRNLDGEFFSLSLPLQGAKSSYRTTFTMEVAIGQNGEITARLFDFTNDQTDETYEFGAHPDHYSDLGSYAGIFIQMNRDSARPRKVAIEQFSHSGCAGEFT